MLKTYLSETKEFDPAAFDTRNVAPNVAEGEESEADTPPEGTRNSADKRENPVTPQLGRREHLHTQ